jgi:photosystem II stability/assembly factor-like uncharacterized protein
MTNSLSAQDCSEERIYVAMLSTRKHRLSGKNPMVGVFYTTDFGQSWSHTGWRQGKAFAVYQPENSCGDTLWVAAGNGVHRTTDGGKTWRITTGWEVTEVQDVWSDPDYPSELWAATPYGVWRSSDFGESWDKLRSGFASSVRGGMVGTEKGLWGTQDRPITKPVRSLRQSPHDEQTWLVALQNGGVRVSTDGAETFSPGSPADQTIYEAEFHPSDPNVIYAGGWGTGLLVSRDLGKTWEKVESLDVPNIHGIAISRSDPSVIIVGSMDNGVFVSTDAGDTWVASAPEIFDQGQIWDVHVRGE